MTGFTTQLSLRTQITVLTSWHLLVVAELLGSVDPPVDGMLRVLVVMAAVGITCGASFLTIETYADDPIVEIEKWDVRAVFSVLALMLLALSTLGSFIAVFVHLL